MKILMVCLGNICRSPIAEGVMQKLANEKGLQWQIDSAGTNGYHTGEAPHKHSQAICKKNGIDISQQRSRRFTSKDFKKYDLIFVMATDVYNDVKQLANSDDDLKKVHYFLDALYPNMNRAVLDPWYGGEEGYTPVFNTIFEGSNAILDKIVK